MTTPPGDRHVSSGTSPLFWRQLLSLLKDGQVIPVVGQDVVTVDGEHGRCTLNEYLARRVETLLDLRPTDPSQPLTLHDVACRYLETAGDRQMGDLYWSVKEALRERPVPVPEALRKLARIEGFKLYVTTTFDDLLQRAIDEERFQGQPRTQAFAYQPERVQDIPSPVNMLTVPAVYYLLGRLSATQDFVVTEEDTLEFVHSLQLENRRPNLLLDEMRSHSLLLIGSGYSDWLMRFFLRIAKRERLLLAGASSPARIVVDARARDDASLAEFVRHFSGQTKVFTGGALEFIDELSARWEEQRETVQERGWTPQGEQPEAEPADSIFVSYASEDRQIVERLVDAFRAAGLPVWFDKSGGLQGGEDYEMKIQARIRSASLFVPVLSRTVLTREKRFFRFEWDEAIKVERQTAENQAFIVPVRMDNVPPDSSSIPLRFRELHWLDADPDTGYSAIVTRVKALYREYQLGARVPA
jgi:hypothetical protein